MAISIVIPTLNEAANVKPLIERIDAACRSAGLEYELIFVDDRSTDNTLEMIQAAAAVYPAAVYAKAGRPGKAFSLLEGFARAKYDVVAMIDADLQYPPEALPLMYAQLEIADVVVANRTSAHTGPLRQASSRIFHLIFSRLLHGVKQDAQSGLKMFKKHTLQDLILHPTPWTFDLELLVSLKRKGYEITTIDIDFARRQHGISKISLPKASAEIAFSALKLKARQLGTISTGSTPIFNTGGGFNFKGREFTTHTNLHHSKTALLRTTLAQKILLLLLLEVAVIAFILDWHGALKGLISVITILYFLDLFFNAFLVYRSFSRTTEIHIAERELRMRKRAWPSYTIFCPLYKESEVLPQFIKAIKQLDYPKHRLEVQLLLEEGDSETIEAAAVMNLPEYIKMLIVPRSQPKTKPKACNYGLMHARGQYAVIYDAEDIPDKDQLKKAVIAFEKAAPNVVCIQAKLNYYNTSQNILTRLFTLEYSLWFDLILPGLQSLNAPIPLGGTSNHFPTKELRKLGGWDPFNVTEDADLGMRLAKQGYRTAILNSTTMEEANSQFGNWLKQRSRWVKGYIQTYLVHMRKPRDFMYKNKLDLLFLQLVVGGKALSLLINPILWIITIVYFTAGVAAGEFIDSLYSAPIYYIGIISLFLGNFLYLYYYMIGAAKRNQWEIVPYGLLVPVYWLMMSLAAYYAVWELIVRPFYWQKTRHGLHLQNQKFRLQAEQLTGGGNG